MKREMTAVDWLAKLKYLHRRLNSIFVNRSETENKGRAIDNRLINFLCITFKYSATIIRALRKAVSPDVIGKMPTPKTEMRLY